MFVLNNKKDIIVSEMQKVKQNKLKSKRLRLIDVFLIIGLTLLMVGIISSFICYTTYTAGRQAHLYSGRFGTKYYPERDPGNPDDKNLAIFSLKVAGIGFISSTVCLVIMHTHKIKDEG
jgi:ABC-type Fe3+ transport system permease subunit